LSKSFSTLEIFISLKIFTSEASEIQFVNAQLNFTDKVVGSITSTQETSTVVAVAAIVAQVLVDPVLAVAVIVAQVSAEAVAYKLVNTASVNKICFLFNIVKNY
jgi:uncharacterized membrane protein